MNFLNGLREIGFTGLIDITFMSLLIYAVLVWFKKTRAGFVLTGIVIVAGIYLLTRQFNLVMTAELFERFFAVFLIAIVVIFQEELKQFFEQIAVWSLNRRLTRRKIMRLSRQEVDVLVRTLMDLAREYIGALIVLKGKDMILRHLDGGVDLGGEVSEPLLKSLFDPHSVGHDGAVIMEGNRITQFGSHLPLSKNLKKVTGHGTRHAAALGLAERCDALCLVVSEEQGTISIARNGDMEKIADAEKLTVALERFYQEVSPRRNERPWHDFFRKNWREKIYAVILSLGLWFVFVHGLKLTYQTYSIPVTFSEIPKPWSADSIEPSSVDVTFRGPRSTFYLTKQGQIKLFVHLPLKEGRQRVRILPTNFIYPKNVVLENIEPDSIVVELKKLPAETGPKENSAPKTAAA